ncbi:hypothetical protein PT974_08039 [Cladobotryum mycophilum]|uniref:Uncharacterized protein n=1 Tax=Cladobotryum mycophilum TaxID=491253 RepID=A0ABR0SC82_9HYPO
MAEFIMNPPDTPLGPLSLKTGQPPLADELLRMSSPSTASTEDQEHSARDVADIEYPTPKIDPEGPPPISLPTMSYDPDLLLGRTEDDEASALLSSQASAIFAKTCLLVTVTSVGLLA